MDCEAKDGLIIFLLILSNILLSIMKFKSFIWFQIGRRVILEREKENGVLRMDCDAKDGLIIFLLILSGILAAIVTGGLILLCRKKVELFIWHIAKSLYVYVDYSSLSLYK